MQLCAHVRRRAREASIGRDPMGRKKNGKSKPHVRASSSSTARDAETRGETETDAGDAPTTINQHRASDGVVVDARDGDASMETTRTRASNGGDADEPAGTGEDAAATSPPPVELRVTVRPVRLGRRRGHDDRGDAGGGGGRFEARVGWVSLGGARTRGGD